MDELETPLVPVEPVTAPVRRGRWRLIGAALVGFLVVVSWQVSGKFRAAETARWQPVITASRDRHLADCDLMIFARRALQDDIELGPYNVGVTVRNGVAVVWGALPSQELARRADDKLHQVAGLMRVENDVRIEPAGAIQRRSLFAMPTPGDGEATPFDTPRATGALASLENDARPALRPSVLKKTDDAPPPEAVTLMPPLAVIERSPPPRGVQSETARLMATPEALKDALDRLHSAEPRFQPIQFELRGSVVQITGGADRAEDRMDFAQAAARIKGVERVILGLASSAANASALQLP